MRSVANNHSKKGNTMTTQDDTWILSEAWETVRKSGIDMHDQREFQRVKRFLRNCLGRECPVCSSTEVTECDVMEFHCLSCLINWSTREVRL